MRNLLTAVALCAALAACGTTQPTMSGAGGAHFDANCTQGGGSENSLTGAAHLSCITVVTNGSPTTATPTATTTTSVPVQVTVPVSAVPSIP